MVGKTMAARISGPKGPGLHKCGLRPWTAADLGLTVSLNKSGQEKIVALRMTARLRGAQLNVNLAELVNKKGFIAGLTDLGKHQQLTEELSRVTGFKVRLLYPAEARQILESPNLAGFRNKLKGGGITSLATQTDPQLTVIKEDGKGGKTETHVRLYGTINGGITYTEKPTIVNPAEFGIILVVAK
ncbi:MAG: hypothetical protein PHG97_06415 [Candidatus Margulisbacteria bacterium]|nr:hypothetical protein [Candidatus Margulisiibacteriota bacterium]